MASWSLLILCVLQSALHFDTLTRQQQWHLTCAEGGSCWWSGQGGTQWREDLGNCRWWSVPPAMAPRRSSPQSKIMLTMIRVILWEHLNFDLNTLYYLYCLLWHITSKSLAFNLFAHSKLSCSILHGFLSPNCSLFSHHSTLHSHIYFTLTNLSRDSSLY